MKPSNKLLAILMTVLVICTIVTDFILNQAYSKINLNDPFKNYLRLKIIPFKVLMIKGGNGYSIVINQSSEYEMKVLNSRKSFLSTVQKQDTLFVEFKVASNQAGQPIERLAKGLLISCPQVGLISFSGTSNIIQDYTSDKLQVEQSHNAVTRFNDSKINDLYLTGIHNSIFDFTLDNRISNLSFSLANTSRIYLKNVLFTQLHPTLTDSAQMILTAHSVRQLGYK